MACTLQQLQKAEYGILCVLQDICTQHHLRFALAYGTALGAVRHSGFIPWDDDVDVMMPYKDYQKLKKIFKKHRNSIRGVTLTDFEMDVQTPHYLPKLRLENSYMPEPPAEGVQINNGVWVDIFVFCDLARSTKLRSVQEILYQNTVMAHKKYKNKFRMAHGDFTYMDHPMCKLCDKLPDFWRIRLIRRMQNWMARLGSAKTGKCLRMTSYVYEVTLDQDFLYNTTLMPFENRKFPVSLHYDAYLRYRYGDDYMTPIQYDQHTNLEDVILPE